MALFSSRKLNPLQADNARQPNDNWNERLACSMYGRSAAALGERPTEQAQANLWISREPPRLRPL